MVQEVSSKSIDGIVDLVVWAPVKEGFIHAFENVTYGTRAKLVAEALHKVRGSLREFEPEAYYSDTTERILSLFDFRIGVVDRNLMSADLSSPAGLKSVRPRQYIYVVATFDAALEPYMRLIWHPLGPFLDLLMCNCEGYVPATESSFADYLQWVRDHQIDSGIFYATTGLSVRDEVYLGKLEKTERGALGASDEVTRAKLTLDDPEYVAALRRKEAIKRLGVKLGSAAITRPALEALNVLYKLADYYPPDRLLPETPQEVADRFGRPGDGHPADGRFLLRAARSLLKEWNSTLVTGLLRATYKEPLDWFEKSLSHTPQMPKRPDPIADLSQVQGGILTPYGTPEAPITHGALLLFQLTDLAQARAFLATYTIQWENDGQPADGLWRNIGFTYPGLKRLIANDGVLKTFPQEFREGMEERAPMMGDLREHHPRNWQLPVRHWPPPNQGETFKRPPVELSEVDFVIQLRASTPEFGSDLIDFLQPASELFLAQTKPQGLAATPPLLGHMITREIASLAQIPGIQLVTIESMRRAPSATDPGDFPGSTIDHFGFRDGISQPDIQFGIGDGDPRGALAGPETINGNLPLGATPPFTYSNIVRAGEVLLGYRNDRQDTAPATDPPVLSVRTDPAQVAGVLQERAGLAYSYGVPFEAELPVPSGSKLPRWMVNSSFLVVRKIEQDKAAFEAVIGQDVGLPDTLTPEEKREELAARMVGRYRSGKPLINTPSGNFDFEGDKEGVACPFAAHIRRTNPRDHFQGRRAPRLLRRGMSFGPTDAASNEPRGVMFMAYNSSIAEQFETVQRWINGGNSTGVASFQNDPLAGINPKAGEERVFRFVYNDGLCERVIKVPIKKPLTKLHWGTYLFTPSRDAIAYLSDPAIAQENTTAAKRVSMERGDDVIRQIEALPEQARGLVWKAVLEDFQTKDPTEKSIGPDVWRAIRIGYNGIYRLPFGVNASRIGDNRNFGGGATSKILELPDELAALQSDCPLDKPQVDRQIIRSILVGSKSQIEAILADHETFSSQEQNKRFTATTSAIYVAMDPKSQLCPHSKYEEESKDTNKILFGTGVANDPASYEASFEAGYNAGKAILKTAKDVTDALFTDVGNPGPRFFKMELKRQYIMPALGELCRYWFDIPDNLGPAIEEGGRPTSKYVERGAWGWDPPWTQKEVNASGKRMPRCPGDFMAQSRHAFYPDPTDSITSYAYLHGEPLRDAVQALVKAYRSAPHLLKGKISKPMFEAIKDDDLLYRNLLGIMVGMLPPSDANLRSVAFEWLTEATLWQHQGALHRETQYKVPTWAQADRAFGPALRQAMCKRPAPDLIYRTVRKPVRIGNYDAAPGDLVIMGLVSATAEDANTPLPQNPDVSPIFGGHRKGVTQAEGAPAHACPAYKMAMGSMTGIMAALLDAGRIQAQPASLIVRISDWK
jgi:deferrochelatase/peroxidase EfeB